MGIPRITDPLVAFTCLVLYALSYGSLSTYLPSQITTLEKRYDLSSAMTGGLLGANDAAYLLCIFFVAYFGTHYISKPKLLAMSGLLNALSAFFYALPFFIYGPRYQKYDLHHSTILSRNATSLLDAACNFNSSQVDESLTKSIPSSEKYVTYSLHMLAGLINGVASTPFWNVGIAFLDDMFGKNSGMFLGILFCIRAFAPIIGFSFGAFIASVHETLGLKSGNHPGGQKDPMWIGAWWLGFVCLGSILLCVTPFLALFKTSDLVRKGNKSGHKDSIKPVPTDGEDELDGKNIFTISNSKVETKEEEKPTMKSMIQMYASLFKNRIYVFLISGTICEIIGFILLINFFPKYLEFRYRVTTTQANMMSAIAMAGSRIVAGAISGSVSKIFPMKTRQLLVYHAIVNTIACVLFAILIFIPCAPSQIYGLEKETIPELNCTENCRCPMAFKPVCVDGAKTFYSACHAACRTFINNTHFGNCSCSDKVVVAGRCEEMCMSVYVYLVLFFLINVIGSVASVQFTQIIMRQVIPKHKPSSLAMLGFVFGVFGFILPPVVGKLLDQVCLMHNYSKTGKSFCILYNTEKAHTLLNTYCFVMQIPACTLFILAWWWHKSRNLKDPEEDAKEPQELASMFSD